MTTETHGADYDIITIGGGAAGFFASLEIARIRPDWRIAILEKSGKLLSKVRISGGGRCNVTHHCFDAGSLVSHYPRGGKFLKSVFRKFQASDMVAWLTERGVDTHTEVDGRMFPSTNDSQTIIDCFLDLARQNKIELKLGEGVVSIGEAAKGFKLTTASGKMYAARKVLITTGGNPNLAAYDFISRLGHPIRRPVPSLFTFNDPHSTFKDLMGVSVSDASVRLEGTKFEQHGPVLITHWGLSGPAVIKLSAWAAEYLFAQNYSFTAYVNWTGNRSEEEIRNYLQEHQRVRGKQIVVSNPLFGLPSRLWTRLCGAAEIPDQRIWSELPKKSINKLIESLIRCRFDMQGKTTFKEEFVTCGGVDLKHIDPETMQSKLVPGIFFAGEVLDIDGETGGFNFQAAWSTAYAAAQHITAQGR